MPQARQALLLASFIFALAPRAAWRRLATKYRADLKIIECICADEATHRRRIEARVRDIDGMAEITWARVEERRASYEAWTDARLTLDTSADAPEKLLAEAIRYLAQTVQHG